MHEVPRQWRILPVDSLELMRGGRLPGRPRGPRAWAAPVLCIIDGNAGLRRAVALVWRMSSLLAGR